MKKIITLILLFSTAIALAQSTPVLTDQRVKQEGENYRIDFNVQPSDGAWVILVYLSTDGGQTYKGTPLKAVTVNSISNSGNKFVIWRVEEEGIDLMPEDNLMFGIEVMQPISVSVNVGDFWVASRNLGATEDGPCRNYSNDEDHADHKYKSLKGGYYTWNEALTACPDGWRLPTEKELEVISDAMQISDGRAYLVDGDGSRCYFPLSVRSSYSSVMIGEYWSLEHAERNERIRNPPPHITIRYGSAIWDMTSSRLSLRCVK